MPKHYHHPVAGATGEYSHPKARPDDLGGLNVAIAVDHAKKIIVWDFGDKPITWAAMTREEALALCAFLKRKAEELPA